MLETRENAIEWLTGDKTISVTLSQKSMITKVERLQEKYPEMVHILARNKDGSIFCHLPLKSLKLSIKMLDDSTKKEMRERLEKARAMKR